MLIDVYNFFVAQVVPEICAKNTRFKNRLDVFFCYSLYLTDLVPKDVPEMYLIHIYISCESLFIKRTTLAILEYFKKHTTSSHFFRKLKFKSKVTWFMKNKYFSQEITQTCKLTNNVISWALQYKPLQNWVGAFITWLWVPWGNKPVSWPFTDK